MIKSLLVLSALLPMAYGRALSQEMICKREEILWAGCSSIWVPPAEPPKDQQDALTYTIDHYKDTLECAGELKCKGTSKMMKYHTEFQIFYLENQKEIHCDAKNQFGEIFSKCSEASLEFRTCVKNAMEELDSCTADEKRAMVRIILAHKDLNDVWTSVNNEEGIKNFDREFDASKFE